jgi:hypothetical protein
MFRQDTCYKEKHPERPNNYLQHMVSKQTVLAMVGNNQMDTAGK